NVNVIRVNDGPNVTTTAGSVSYTEGTPSIAVDAGLTVSDVDRTNAVSATIWISGNYVQGKDFLDYTNQLGITQGSGFNLATGTINLSGTGSFANYQPALGTITSS